VGLGAADSEGDGAGAGAGEGLMLAEDDGSWVGPGPKERPGLPDWP
jgi:hypothetical protein